jgi:cysteine desulfurase
VSTIKDGDDRIAYDAPVSKSSIYMDHHATTPCDPAVVEAMLPFFSEQFGNAASRFHTHGKQARHAVEKARLQIATLIGANPREIVFTSGATESLNLALQGLARARTTPGHFVSTNIEHPAVLDTLKALEAEGHSVTLVNVDPSGFVSPEAIEEAITEKTMAVCVIGASNEIGTIQPLAHIADVTRPRGIPLISDTTQWVGNMSLDVNALGVDMATLSAHKLYGPKGIGCLYVRRRRPAIALAELTHGGGHERGLRSGTLNVPGIVGFGAAAVLCSQQSTADAARMAALRDTLLAGLTSRLTGVHVNGSMDSRLSNNLNVSIQGVEGRKLMEYLPEVALSTGSACSSAEAEPSHVIRALGFGDARAVTALRFGLGRHTTQAEVDDVVERVVQACLEIRQS